MPSDRAATFTEPVWEYPVAADDAAVSALADEWTLSRPVAELLWRRVGPDIDSERVKRFLHPRFEHLHDPYLMSGMAAAVDRVVRAVYAREDVTIFGDYDVDGTTSTALLVSTLERLAVPVSWRIPNRESDGYGLSDRGVELVRETPGTLVITVDCGVTSVEQVAALNADGRDVIIVDHHEPGGDTLPDAVAVLDPKRHDCAYPFDGLAAVGVAFKLVQALEDTLGAPPGTLVLPALDLVAVGTAADIVPIRDENRVIMRTGLRRLARSPRPGLASLVDVAGVREDRLTTSHVVFGPAPRINAAGRMGSAGDAVRLLLSEDRAQAMPIAQQLDAANRNRQSEDRATLAAAETEAREQFESGARALVLADRDWSPGIVGIVAARLVERFYLPTVMIALGDEVGRGSGRSIEGFDLHAALGMCADTLESFGGHVRAAGLSIQPDRVAEFRERLQRVAAELVTDDMVRPRQSIDVVADLDDVTFDLIDDIERLGPFGPGNRRPVFLTPGANAAAPPEVLKGQHLKAEVRTGSVTHQLIAFGMADREPLFDGAVDIAYVPEINTFRGRTRIQLRAKAMRSATP